MERKRLFIILGGIGIIILLALLTYYPRMKTSRATNNSNNQEITEITLCDQDASDLCVVTFGTDNTERMLINFQLPNTDYPTFYVKGSNQGKTNLYECQPVKDMPNSINCTGIRTPLGEAIDIEVYATDGDLLMARGTIMITAMAFSTLPPVNTAYPNP